MCHFRRHIAYYTNHSPYSLLKVRELADDFDFSALNGEYFNTETKTSISLQHRKGETYEVFFSADMEASGLLVANNKMLVSSYILEFIDENLLLSGERIKKVKYVRK